MRLRRFLTLTLAAALSLTLTVGCSSDESDDTQQPAWPLTGLSGYPEDDAQQAVIVKIENTSAGRPQVGIGDADIVVQELVEGGLTRLAVMFHSKYPDQAGPVRSMRQTDIGLVLPTGGTLAASGGSAGTLAAVSAAGVATAVEGAPGFSRDSARTAPYNVMLDVGELAQTLPPNPPPAPYFPFGSVPADASGTPAASVDLRWPGDSTSFAYDAASGEWTRTDLPDASGFSFTTVVALQLPVTFSGTDAAGTPIPTMMTTGSGNGWVATAGQVYEVSWSKASNSAPWQFTYAPPATDDGQPAPAGTFSLPAGRTWLALLPQDGGSFDSAPPAASPAP